MRVHGKLVIVPNKSDGNCITTAFRWCLRMADPIPLPACLLMFAVHVNACATALILHCNVTSPIFSRFCPVSLPAFPSLDIYIDVRACIYMYTSPRLFDRYARWIAQWVERVTRTLVNRIARNSTRVVANWNSIKDARKLCFCYSIPLGNEKLIMHRAHFHVTEIYVSIVLIILRRDISF